MVSGKSEYKELYKSSPVQDPLGLNTENSRGN